MRHAGCGERGGEMWGVAADQQRAGDAREEWCERDDAALLRLATGNPDQAVVAAQRAGGGIRVGGLAVVDEGYAGDTGYALLAVRQAGEGFECRRDDVRPLPAGDEAHRDGDGCSGVLRVVRAGKRRYAAQVEVEPDLIALKATIDDADMWRVEALMAGDMDAAAKLGCE